ncbi:hypothetical protein B0H17DRAFT_1216669 [Mycena rosella]|uniref:DUF6535 domain-containing protein n=1 Tax=Mycena rosella TaxID=1033263 RepID=A0AAD7C661_MYCRO|nr:hypothetical protein B0H17DRAFT_1216669 [Mycena rosella]
MSTSTTPTDSAKRTISDTYRPDDADESAGAKLWAVYISEAEKYDKALVESWKSDMEGLLIFAGLFSASLTAFIIESYKSLSQDQGEITIALLAQISRQLDARANAPAADIGALTSFSPTASSLACNVFWFLSLGFSLTCALLATLVEQWARDFIQKTEMHPSPIIRARIFSYLYFGLQRFGMHAMVAFLPLLLHASLFLFFAGLVAFLQPINTLLMLIAALLLGFISAAYTFLTVLPTFESDSPCRTPLSNMAWSLAQHFRAPLNPPDEESAAGPDSSHIPSKNTITMVEAMMYDATQQSQERDKRDARALIWTVESLTDNNELEPFVEALPDLIMGRRTYEGIINTLLETPAIRLVCRIESLLRSCDSGLLAPEVETRRRISCIKAFWSIADFVVSQASTRQFFPLFDHHILECHDSSTVTRHSISAYAVIRWCDFCAVSGVVGNAKSVLGPVVNTPELQNPRALLKLVQDQANRRGYTEFGGDLSGVLGATDGPSWLHEVRDLLASFDNYSYDVLLEYFRNSAALDEMPYEFEATRMRIQPIGVQPNAVVRMKLKNTFTSIIDAHARRLGDFAAIHPIDIMFETVLSLLQESPESVDNALSSAVIVYFRYRIGHYHRRSLRQCTPEFIGDLLTKHLRERPHNTQLPVTDQMWCSCLYPDPPLASFRELTIAAIGQVPRLPTSACVISVLKSHILMRSAHLKPEQLDPLMNRFEIPPSSSGDTLERWQQGHFAILLEFLQHYSSISVLTRWLNNLTVETFEYMAQLCSWTCIPPPLQRRFATLLLDMVNPPSIVVHASMIRTIIYWKHLSSRNFDDPTARSKIREALTIYRGTVLGHDEPSLRLLRAIEIQLSELHSILPGTGV